MDARAPTPRSTRVRRSGCRPPRACCSPWSTPRTARPGPRRHSATRLAAGMYQVAFDQDVAGAAYVGTVGPATANGLVPQGVITVAPRSGIANAVFVETHGASGHADRPFHLAVLA
ncbi:hypothetical protein V2I01_21165 [Micromonospora sp. BRA006-A]|nr:hypothetical protein [Micromonospora sp. BRA006-A]